MIGTRLKEIRISKGLTQKDLARKAGLSVGMISQIESHQRKTITDSFMKILKAMNVSIPYFFSVYSAEEKEICTQVMRIIKSKNIFLKDYLLVVLCALILIDRVDAESNQGLLKGINDLTKHLVLSLKIAERKTSPKKSSRKIK